MITTMSMFKKLIYIQVANILNKVPDSRPTLANGCKVGYISLLVVRRWINIVLITIGALTSFLNWINVVYSTLVHGHYLTFGPISN